MVDTVRSDDGVDSSDEGVVKVLVMMMLMVLFVVVMMVL